MSNIDWSKLSEMPLYAPKGPGKYLMRCGGVVKIEFNGGVWKVIDYVTMYWDVLGHYCYQKNHPFDIIAPAPKIMPWEQADQLEGFLVAANKEYESLYEECESSKQARLKLEEECERLKDEINHWKVKAECYGEMVHGCHPVFVRLGVLDENKSGVGAIANAAQKLAAINKQLESERDEWKQDAIRLKQALERPRSEADIITELHGKQIADLLQRVAMLEKTNNPEPAKDLPPIPEGFTAHVKGAKCPVSKGTRVVVQFGDGSFSREINADFFSSDKLLTADNWRENDNRSRIIAYRVIEPQPEPEPVYKVGDVVMYRGCFFYVAEVSPGIVTSLKGASFLVTDIRHATPAERAAFFAANPTLHTSYYEEMGDMDGWRFLCDDERQLASDEWWNASEKKWKINHPDSEGLVKTYRVPHRRRVQAEKEVGE